MYSSTLLRWNSVAKKEERNCNTTVTKTYFWIITYSYFYCLVWKEWEKKRDGERRGGREREKECVTDCFDLVWFGFYGTSTIVGYLMLNPFLYISWSWCRAGSTDIIDPLSPLLAIVHRPRQVFRTTSSNSCWIYVRAGRPAFARPCVGVHKSTSLMSSSLLLQQCPACLVRLTWIILVIGGRWPYSWCLVGCCCQDLFKIARSIKQFFFKQFSLA